MGWGGGEWEAVKGGASWGQGGGGVRYWEWGVGGGQERVMEGAS